MDDALKGFDIVSDRARVSTEYLVKIREKLLGDERITDIKSDAAIALIEVIIRVWRDLYPDEYQGRLLQQKDDWLVERTVQEANKKDGGFFTVSYPPRVLAMFKALMPGVSWFDRETTKKLVDNFPLLKGTQYHL